MNVLFRELIVMGQMGAQVLGVWLMLQWIGSLPKRVTALAVASQGKRAP